MTEREAEVMRQGAESMMEYPMEIMQSGAGRAEVWLCARRLAKQYLIEHPADDELAVTEDWLRAVGLVEHWYDHVWGIGQDWNADTTGIGIQLNGRVMLRTGNVVAYSSAKASTRGHVRRLLAALGIPLVPAQEPADG